MEDYFFLPALLHSISSSSFSELALELNLLYLINLSGIGWEEIDVILSENPSFDSVHKFLVSMRYPAHLANSAELEGFVREAETILCFQLQDTINRAILEVEYLPCADLL